MKIEIYGMLVEENRAFLRQTGFGLTPIGGATKEIISPVMVDLNNKYLFDLAQDKLRKSFKRIGVDVREIDRKFAINSQVIGKRILMGYAIPTVLTNGTMDLKQSKLKPVAIDDLVNSRINNKLISEGYIRELIRLIAHKYKIS